jgi:hypothetical protein
MNATRCPKQGKRGQGMEVEGKEGARHMGNTDNHKGRSEGESRWQAHGQWKGELERLDHQSDRALGAKERGVRQGKGDKTVAQHRGTFGPFSDIPSFHRLAKGGAEQLGMRGG